MKLFITLATLFLFTVVVSAQDKGEVLQLQPAMAKADANLKPIKSLNLSDNDRLEFQQMADDYKIKLIQVLTDSKLNEASKKEELDLIDFSIQKKLNQSISSNSAACVKYVKDLRQRAEKEGVEFLVTDRFGGEGCNGCGKLN